MTLIRGQLLGRDEEMAEVARFTDRLVNGPACLLFEGEAGIGKTTLLYAAGDTASESDMLVLSTTPVESETAYSYAALGDLLDTVLEEASADLPIPQRLALEVALLRAAPDGPPPDQRAVSVAALGVLRALASSRPVVLAVDDLHWMDASSARILAFAVRRLSAERVGVLASLRTGHSIPEELSRALREAPLRRVRVGPLAPKVLGAVLRREAEVDLPRPLVLRLHEISGGNPFYALEMARTLLQKGIAHSPAEPLPVSESLQDLLGARLATLPQSAADPLLAVAATARPTERLVLAVAPRRDRALTGLARAEEAHVIQREGERIRFMHPLLGSAVYAAASPRAKRSLHGRLATAVGDLEEGARHLALATAGPDPVVAQTLEEAARHARARAAPDAAADLAELGCRLTPPGDVDDIRRRTMEAAAFHFDAGDAIRASGLLEAAIATSPAGAGRAELLYRLGSISWMNLDLGVRRPTEQALAEAGREPELLAAIHSQLAWVALYQGDLEEAMTHARAGVHHSRKTNDPPVQSDALSTLGMVEFLFGRPAHTRMAEAVRLQDAGAREAAGQSTVYTSARSSLGLQLMWSGALDAARSAFHRELDEYERHAMYTVRQEVLCYLAELESRAGRLDAAAAAAMEAEEITVESRHHRGQSHVVLFAKAVVAAHLGDIDGARVAGSEGLRLALESDDPFYANYHRSALGFLELSLGNARAAHEHLKEAVRFLETMGTVELGVIPCVPDEIEALLLLERFVEAEALLDLLERRDSQTDRHWIAWTAARCRGLLMAATGDISGARSALERSLAQNEDSAQPLELGRTLMVLGEVQRRARQKRPARASFERALQIFEFVHASLWAKRARAGLSRVGGPRTAPGELTSTERQIADLVADGMTNREVAEALFISVKTVEANLSRIYHKLGVGSRRDLPGALTASPSDLQHEQT